MKSGTLLAGIVILILIAGAFVFANSNNPNDQVIGSISAKQEEGLQRVSLGMRDYNYYPQTIRVEYNKEVELTLDKEVYGCLRSFTIPAFGVNSYSATPDDKITFVPNKRGTFAFSCSMGMGTGKIIVE